MSSVKREKNRDKKFRETFHYNTFRYLQDAVIEQKITVSEASWAALWISISLVMARMNHFPPEGKEKLRVIYTKNFDNIWDAIVKIDSDTRTKLQSTRDEVEKITGLVMDWSK